MKARVITTSSVQEETISKSEGSFCKDNSKGDLAQNRNGKKVWRGELLYRGRGNLGRGLDRKKKKRGPREGAGEITEEGRSISPLKKLLGEENVKV